MKGINTMEKKLTKREILTAIRADVETRAEVSGIPADVVLKFIDTSIEQIDAKAVKAKERAAEKKTAGDELRAEVLACVTGEFQTADAITACITAEDISKAKVVARLTQLVKSGEVVKEQMKVGDAKLMCYRLAD
jgi:hypothetical protein